MNADEAQQVFDGVMLSDGGIYFAHGGGPGEDAYFDIGLSGWEHCDWLEQILEALSALGLQDVLNSIHRAIKNDMNGRPYEYCGVKTRTHSFFTHEHSRWYSGKRNIIPASLHITPLTLANWYTGDGGSTWNGSGIPNMVEARFATFSLMRRDVEYLAGVLLDSYKVSTSLGRIKGIVKGDGLYIRVRNAASVNVLFDTIEDLIVPSYKYKIKRPWLNKRGPKVGRSYIRYWVPKQGW